MSPSLEFCSKQQVRCAHAKCVGQLNERQECDIVVAPFDPPDITSIKLGQEGELFLGHSLLQPGTTDRLAEGGQRWVLAIFGEVWHIRIIPI